MRDSKRGYKDRETEREKESEWVGNYSKTTVMFHHTAIRPLCGRKHADHDAVVLLWYSEIKFNTTHV